MEYGLTKKMVFLLYEYHFNANNDVEEDLCRVINQLEAQDWYDLRYHHKECIQALHNISTKHDMQSYNWIQDCNHLIEYLKYLPIHIAEEQGERAIARSEALGDYIYENGYDEVIKNGFIF